MSKVSMILNMISVQRKLLGRAAQLGVRNISVSSACRKNHYETLGVPRDATQAEIKNAYFELSKLYHPDRIAATDENLAKFREVSTAYEILGNEHSRKLYDRGMIGDFKKAEDEVVDPIVKFYQQRQEVSKHTRDPEMDAWAQTYFAEAKKRASQKHQLYRKARKFDPFEEDLAVHKFEIFIVCVVGYFFMTNFKNSEPEKKWRKVASTIGL